GRDARRHALAEPPLYDVALALRSPPSGDCALAASRAVKPSQVRRPHGRSRPESCGNDAEAFRPGAFSIEPGRSSRIQRFARGSRGSAVRMMPSRGPWLFMTL